MHVVDSIHHLVEVGPGHFFRKLAGLSYEVEKFSASCIFEDDGEAGGCELVAILEDGVLSYADQLDEVFVV